MKTAIFIYLFMLVFIFGPHYYVLRSWMNVFRASKAFSFERVFENDWAIVTRAINRILAS